MVATSYTGSAISKSPAVINSKFTGQLSITPATNPQRVTSVSPSAVNSAFVGQYSITPGKSIVPVIIGTPTQISLPSGTFTKISELGNRPVADFSHEGAYAVDLLGRMSPQASLPTVLHPGYTNADEMIQVMNSPTATAEEKAKAQAAFDEWQKTASEYLKEGGYAKQAMFAALIAAHPKHVWDKSSSRMYVDGRWMTYPEAYQHMYGGDPYLDATSKPFTEVYLAEAARDKAIEDAHNAKLATKAENAVRSACGMEPSSPPPAEVVTPSGDVITPDRISGVDADGNALPPTGAAAVMNTKNLVMIIAVLGILYVLFTVFDSGPGDAGGKSGGGKK